MGDLGRGISDVGGVQPSTPLHSATGKVVPAFEETPASNGKPLQT